MSDEDRGTFDGGIKLPDVAPLTFFPHLDVLLARHVFPPGFLNGPGVAIELALPCLFQQKELEQKNEMKFSQRQTHLLKPRHTQTK